MKPFAVGKLAKDGKRAIDRAGLRWGYAMLLWSDKWVVRFVPITRKEN